MNDEPLIVNEGAWRKLPSHIDPLQTNFAVASDSQERALARLGHHVRSPGKSWARWHWLLARQLSPMSPAEELKEAVRWAVRDQGNP